MAKVVTIPKLSQVRPISLTCPLCKAKPDHECTSISGGFGVLHMERIRAAAAMDEAKRKTLEDISQAAAWIVREAREIV